LALLTTACTRVIGPLEPPPLPALIVIKKVPLDAIKFASVTVTVRLKGLPVAVVGFPDSSPAPDSDSPGTDPVMVQVNGAVPPLAASCCE